MQPSEMAQYITTVAKAIESTNTYGTAKVLVMYHLLVEPMARLFMSIGLGYIFTRTVAKAFHWALFADYESISKCDFEKDADARAIKVIFLTALAVFLGIPVLVQLVK